jgi:hypothetical protein
MKAVMVAASRRQEPDMTHISYSGLETLSEQQLRLLYTELLDALARSGLTIDECPMTAQTLASIRSILQKRKPRGPGF